jgi:glycerol-3-phosphate dehydrogenase
VLLVEMDDLACLTSSASSKLIHGGLRYLEQYEFGLVRESLHERETMLRTAPHLVRPLEFILPDPPGGRPWWMIRAGLLLYDLLRLWRGSLPRARGLKRNDPRSAALKPGHKLASYWDAWVDDARLVALNAVAAAEKGAESATRTELLSARRDGDAWEAALSGGRTVRAGILVNAAGPWVSEVLNKRLETEAEAHVRLIKGSHIVTPRLYEGEHAFILQQPDGRVVFALPYGAHNLIGTTDIAVGAPADAVISPEEVVYLCDAANRYFVRRVAPGEVIWSYAGVRALYDDGEAEAKNVTRDYRLELDDTSGPKLLSVFGGKITTARHLADEALAMLGITTGRFTRLTPLPGGDVDAAFNRRLAALATWMPAEMIVRLSRAYGTQLDRIVGDATSLKQLGRHFGDDLYEAEVRYLIEHEFARTADDILWRRTKLGLSFERRQRKALETWLGTRGRAGG